MKSIRICARCAYFIRLTMRCRQFSLRFATQPPFTRRTYFARLWISTNFHFVWICQDMFVKANAKAMPHVVHYLLMIYSPTIFRKKFRWPVTTKCDEADFRWVICGFCSWLTVNVLILFVSICRQATLTFFNELSSKYNWKIGPFKMQLILFPGGVEFMKLIQHFSNLVMRFELDRETSPSMHS